MRPPFSVVRAGDAVGFSASRENAITETVLAHRFSNLAGPTPTPALLSPLIVEVRNTTGADRSRFDVVGLSAAIISAGDNLETFHRQGALDAVEPVWPDHYSLYAVLQQPIRDGAIGQAMISGVTSCQVNFADSNAAAGHDYATLADGTYSSLDSAPCGVARILARESGTGAQWCKILLGAPSPAGGLARTPSGGLPLCTGSNFPYTPGSASCDVATWSGGNLVDDEWNMTIYNAMGGAVAGNVLIIYLFDRHGKPWAVAEWCP